MSKLRKRILAQSALLMAVVGVVFVSLPFGLSLFPSERADAARPRIKISDLTPGSFKLVAPGNAYETYNGFKRSAYIYKNNANEVRVWDVYTKNGEVGMPDYFWWRVYFTCKDFGPSSVNGVIGEASIIRCRDKDLTPWQSDNWKWRLDGKAITQNVTDMARVDGLVEGNYYVIGKAR